MSDIENIQLSSIFHEGLDLFNNIQNSKEPTNSLDTQLSIKKCMKYFEQATPLVSLANIFSNNETIDELATNDIQYLLLPALLGLLSLKLTSGERKDIIEVAEIYFIDFLKRTNEYGLSNYVVKENKTKDNETRTEDEFEQLRHAVNTRANKIQRFNEKKQLQTCLESLKQDVENEHVDEEIKRNYFLTMIKVFIHEVIDELISIEMEKPILEHRAKIKSDDIPNTPREKPPPLKPIIITRDEVQKAVYGAGYPSLATMTVQEFYDKRVAEGVFPDPNKPRTAPMSLQDAALSGASINDEDVIAEETENKEEQDNEEYIQKMRARDEFKDDHRRGWGNRMNRS
ncbi:immunoglobulin-binding protein 1 [Cylas formicarius]|uniref:immunoglobulin-binding protein 1 n=1 Tax=Cylas formicarius TaxID=197179 RepID=UPI002958C0C4|nr:immunoglobulin-binding protein 1 [Cylas formicarius]